MILDDTFVRKKLDTSLKPDKSGLKNKLSLNLNIHVSKYLDEIYPTLLALQEECLIKNPKEYSNFERTSLKTILESYIF
jgi:hypothetical protein